MMVCVVSKQIAVSNRNAAEVLTLMRSGFSVRWIGGSAGVGEAAKPRRKRRSPNITTEQANQIVALRKKGLVYRIIGRRMRLSTSAVRAVCIRSIKGESK